MIHHVPIVRLHPLAEVPRRASSEAAGFDLHALSGVVLAPGQRALIQTGIALAIPVGHVGYVRPRSGLALKHGLDVLAGVIDSDYRGDVGVVLINHGTESYEVGHGDRIAQLVIQPLSPVHLQEVETVSDMVQSQRGAGGFGSTGVGVI